MVLMRTRFYTHCMRIITIITLLAAAQPAFAMNWEGHDDWMIEFPPAQPFIEAEPKAKLPAPRNCSIGPIARAANPYEQIPLPRHNCATPQPRKLPGS